MSAKKVRVGKSCECCGRAFEVTQREVNRGRGRFCSRSCHGKVRGAAVLKTTSPRGPNRGSFRKGENVGESHPRFVPRLRFRCEFCESDFEVQAWVAKQTTNRNRFCSARCRSRHRSVFGSGPNAPDYVGGKVTYRGPNWIEARTAVIVAQKGACAHCGVFRGKRLPVHHIKPFREFESYVEANRRENLIGLCQSCHMKAERPVTKRRRVGPPSSSPRPAKPSPGRDTSGPRRDRTL